MNSQRKALSVSLLVLVAAALLYSVNHWRARHARRVYFERHAAAAPLSVEKLGVLDATLQESSGLAVSRAHPGVFWTHNDSGDGPRVYAIDRSGTLLATFEILGAEARDWEDADLGPCPRETSRSCLWLGDIGDNGRQRDLLTVYVVAEPDPTTPDRRIPLVGRLRYTYPDEAHDAEALAIGPDGELVIVTKGRTPTILLYVIDPETVRAAIRSDTVVELPAGHRIPIEPDRRLRRVVTGASFRPDGTVLAVRTYSEIFFYDWPIAGEPAEAMPACFLGNLQPIGESVAYQDAESLLLTTETTRTRPGNLLRVRCAEGPRGQQ